MQLTLAAENGSILAMLILSDWHGNNPPTLHSQPDRARELHWLRQAANLGNETACLVLGDRLVDGRVAESCSQAEIDEIEKYYQGAHYTSEAFYKLARFHSDGKQGTDYTRDAYSKARMWLRRGKDRHFTGGKSCADLLLKWGLLVEEKEVKVSPASPCCQTTSTDSLRALCLHCKHEACVVPSMSQERSGIGWV